MKNLTNLAAVSFQICFLRNSVSEITLMDAAGHASLIFSIMKLSFKLYSSKRAYSTIFLASYLINVKTFVTFKKSFEFDHFSNPENFICASFQGQIKFRIITKWLLISTALEKKVHERRSKGYSELSMDVPTINESNSKPAETGFNWF